MNADFCSKMFIKSCKWEENKEERPCIQVWVELWNWVLKSWKPSGLTATSCQLLYIIVWYKRCLLFSLEFWQKRLIVALTWISIKNHSCLCYKTARVPNSVVVVDVLVLLLLILQTMVNPLIPGLTLWVDKDKWLVVINYYKILSFSLTKFSFVDQQSCWQTCCVFWPTFGCYKHRKLV